MATAFNLLRSNDLIWPYVVNNYMRGKKPFAVRHSVLEFRRHPHAGGQSFVLFAQLLSRQQSQPKAKWRSLASRSICTKVKLPIYNLATREDHIAPAKSVLYGSQFFGGPVKYVLAGSGHIAGVINPPGKPKYQYWTGEQPSGSDVDKWLSTATEHPGSWWPDWLDWLKAQGAETVPAREIGAASSRPSRTRRGLM